MCDNNIDPTNSWAIGRADQFNIEARHPNCVVVGIANEEHGDLVSNRPYEFVIRFHDGTEFRKLMSKEDRAMFSF